MVHRDGESRLGWDELSSAQLRTKYARLNILPPKRNVLDVLRRALQLKLLLCLEASQSKDAVSENASETSRYISGRRTPSKW